MADIIRIGDIVTDENQSGIVLRISNNLVTWRSSTTGRVFRTSMSKLRKDDGRSKPIENQNVAAPINQGKGSDPNIQGGNINAGCTNPNALNYDETVSQDDGSCIFNLPLSWDCGNYQDGFNDTGYCYGPGRTS